MIWLFLLVGVLIVVVVGFVDVLAAVEVFPEEGARLVRGLLGGLEVCHGPIKPQKDVD